MADVAGRTGDRGQLILITAVGIAALLVLVALALNTAVVGEIHVSKTDDDLREERVAVEYRDGVRRGVGGALPFVNETTAEYHELEAAVVDDFESEIAAWDELARREYAREGAATNASLNRTYLGTYVVHDNESEPFTDRDGNANWTLAENAPAVVAYRMNLSDDDLAQVDDCASEDHGGCFHLVVDDGAWELSAYENSSKVIVEVDGEKRCETNRSSVPIDITNGSFGVPDCDDGFTTFRETVEAPYTLAYAGGDEASGTYELVVGEELDRDAYHGPETGESPRVAPAVVAADVTLVYRSADLTYRTEIQVAPGESDE